MKHTCQDIQKIVRKQKPPGATHTERLSHRFSCQIALEKYTLHSKRVYHFWNILARGCFYTQNRAISHKIHERNDIMAKAKKLKSGSWRCLVYDYTDASGKRHYKSFTCDDPSPKGKRKAELMAAEYVTTERTAKFLENKDMTLGDAWDAYVENRSLVLSPGTIREYKRSRKSDLKTLMTMKLTDITLDDVQIAINNEGFNHSPKTVRNIHGLLSAVMGTYRPSFSLKTDLPKPKRPDLYIPSDENIKTLLKHLEKTAKWKFPCC